MSERPFADWPIELLKEYEQRLYDDEVLFGVDTWRNRDEVLWELAARSHVPRRQADEQ